MDSNDSKIERTTGKRKTRTQGPKIKSITLDATAVTTIKLG